MSSRRATKFKPPEDSLTWRVIDYLGSNPGERLTRSDVAKKFDVDASAVDSELAGAVMAGQLIRETNDEDGVVWKLRYRGAKFPVPFTGTLAAAKKAVRARRKPPVVVDFSRITIEKGVPLYEAPKKVSHWNLVFSRMERGDSFAVPVEARDALAHAQQNYRSKVKDVVFALRRVSDTHVRIWRTV